MIVTIGGKPGSGKSTIAAILCQVLIEQGFDYEVMDVGKLRREAAKDQGMTLEAYNDWSKQNPDVGDKAFDDYVAKQAQMKRDLVVIGRMAFHTLPQSVKIFIDVDERVGAERIFREKQQDLSRNESEVSSVEEQLQLNRERIANDRARYKPLYNIDPYDPKHFTMVIDSTNMTPEEVVDRILEKL